MIQILLPSDPAESLTSSHFYMMVASICLMCGKNIWALIASFVVIYMLYEQTHISTRLEKWYLVSLVSVILSLGSWVLLSFDSATSSSASAHNKAWYFGLLLEKIGGLLIGYLVYIEAFESQSSSSILETTSEHGGENTATNVKGTSSKALSSSKISPHQTMNESNRRVGRRRQLSRQDSLVKTVTLQVRIKQGRDLVAKDTNIFGKKTTSDPYAKIYIGSTRTLLGKTKIKTKTLNPTWEQSFRKTILARSLSDYKHIIVHLFDHDTMSKDDPMGTVVIPLPSMDNLKFVNWYDVTTGDGEMYCSNATGQIYVEIEIQS